MAESIAPLSPRFKARIAGVLYLVSGMAYAYAESSVRGKLVVNDNAAATAQNILAHTLLYRCGFAAELISSVFYIVVTLLLYDILKPVSRTLSLAAAFFSLAGCAIQALSSLFHLTPLIILRGDGYLNVFKPEQLQALALLFLKLRAQATNIYMIFFGCYCLLLGALIFKSKFLPRVLGVFLVVAGLSYQIFISPPLAVRLFPYVMAPAGALGELTLVFWLIVMGVNPQRWQEQANLAERHG